MPLGQIRRLHDFFQNLCLCVPLCVCVCVSLSPPLSLSLSLSISLSLSLSLSLCLALENLCASPHVRSSDSVLRPACLDYSEHLVVPHWPHCAKEVAWSSHWEKHALSSPDGCTYSVAGCCEALGTRSIAFQQDCFRICSQDFQTLDLSMTFNDYQCVTSTRRRHDVNTTSTRRQHNVNAFKSSFVSTIVVGFVEDQHPSCVERIHFKLFVIVCRCLGSGAVLHHIDSCTKFYSLS